MKPIPLSILAVAHFLLASGSARAQSPPPAPDKIALGDFLLAPSLEIRMRAEYMNSPPDLGGSDPFGRQSPRVRDAWTASERSRLGLGVERGILRAQLTLQDARALGSGAPDATFAPASNAARFGAYEAFLEVHDRGARPSYVRLGRQAVVWGEGRLLGDADFSPMGRSLDAARAHYAAGNVDIEALAAVLEAPSPLGSSFSNTSGPSRSGVELYGALARWSAAPLFRIEAYALARISRSKGDNFDGSRFSASRLSGETYTGALRIFGDARGWDYAAEGAYQFGRANALAIGGADVSAWAAAAHIAKTLPEIALTPTLRIAGSYASGDDGSGSYHQFDPLLADPQRFHGQMDLFAWSNAMDASARVQIVPWAQTSFAVEYRYARLARTSGEWIGSYLTSLGRAAGSTGAGLGSEIDAAFTWRAATALDIRIGWSGLILGDGARAIMSAEARGTTEPGGTVTAPTFAQYAYAQATLTVP
ncbi:MAG: alginate export family protein [Polyangiaceae bacterium]|nr:alginate export family protein [Polyangiaceae bacterium]